MRCTCSKVLLDSTVRDLIQASNSPNGQVAVMMHLNLFLEAMITHEYHISSNITFKTHPCPFMRQISNSAFNLLTYNSPAPRWIDQDSVLIHSLLGNKKTKPYFNPIRTFPRTHITLKARNNLYRVKLIPDYYTGKWKPITTNLFKQIKQHTHSISKKTQKELINSIIFRVKFTTAFRKLPNVPILRWLHAPFLELNQYSKEGILLHKLKTGLKFSCESKKEPIKIIAGNIRSLTENKANFLKSLEPYQKSDVILLNEIKDSNNLKPFIKTRHVTTNIQEEGKGGSAILLKRTALEAQSDLTYNDAIIQAIEYSGTTLVIGTL